MTELPATRQSSVVQARDLPPPEGEEVPQPPEFTEIFENNVKYVWRSLRRLGVRDRDLDDLTHDVFLQVYRHFDEYDDTRPLRPWLFGFAFRVAAGYRRRARHRLEVVADVAEPADPAPSALERLEQAEILELAQAALDELELGRRAVFILHDIDEQPIPEIARALGIPLNTAYSRLRVAREQFSTILQRLRRRRGGR